MIQAALAIAVLGGATGTLNPHAAGLAVLKLVTLILALTEKFAHPSCD